MPLQFKKTFRLKDWWDSKIPPLMAIVYLRVLLSDFRNPFAISMGILLFLVWAIAAAGFGHYVNDCFDIESDNKAGKPNQAAQHSPVLRVLICSLLAVLAIMPWLLLPASPLERAVVISHLVLFILYSAPPIRLKERGFAGVVADASYAHLVPVFLAFSVLSGLLSWREFMDEDPFIPSLLSGTGLEIPMKYILLPWAFFHGLRGILGHQLQDHDKDVQSGTKTFVTGFGKKFTAGIIQTFLVPFELLFFLLIWILALEINSLPLLVLLGAFILYKSYLQKRVWKIPFGAEHGIPFFNSILNNFYEQWLPLILLGYLCWLDWRFGFVLLGHLGLFQQTWRKAVGNPEGFTK